MLNFVIKNFTIFPLIVFSVTLAVFVLRLDIGKRGKKIWAVVLALACAKFACFKWFGGNAYAPDFPEWLLWSWNALYSSAAVLFALSIVFFFKFRWKGRILATVALSIGVLGVWTGIRPPTLHEIEIAYPDLPDSLDGYRILQISDLHVSNSVRAWRTRKVVELANSAGADLICLTGDYQDGIAETLHDALEPITGLRARDGVWAVSGNHDHFRNHAGWWWWYKRWGIRFLANECVFPHPGLALGGVNDDQCASVRKRSAPIGAAVPNVGRTFAAATNGEFRVLMQHQPRHAEDNLLGHCVRLQLSGHTHGGIMPLFDLIVKVANNGFVHGRYDLGNGVLYVNRGAGQWAGFPMRLMNPSEITLIRLTKSR